MNENTVTIPVALPANWTAETDMRGVVITAYDSQQRSQGSVTVCAKARGFTLGVARVYTGDGAKRYVGRGWEAKLYVDAIAALQNAWQ